MNLQKKINIYENFDSNEIELTHFYYKLINQQYILRDVVISIYFSFIKNNM